MGLPQRIRRALGRMASGRAARRFGGPPMPIDVMFAQLYAAASGAPVSREAALSVPAVLRGRNLICAISTLPLVQVGPRQQIVDNPLLRQLDPDVANIVTLAQTIEDLVLDSISWWMVTAQDTARYPLAVRHLDVDTVSLTPPAGMARSPAPLPSGWDPREATVWVDGQPVGASRIIRFDSPNPPVRIAVARAIRRALLLDQAARMYAEDPRPQDYFTPADGADPIDDPEVEAILAKWRSARRHRATGYIPASLKYNTVDSPSPADLQLAELQKQAGLDIANALGIDPEDLGISTTSRTYFNAIDRRQSRINDVLSPYMQAITQRLSMGDVTRRGHQVSFDLDDYMRADPITRVEYYTGLHGLGAITMPEIRQEERMPPLPEPTTPAPIAGPPEQPATGEPAGAPGELEAIAAAVTFGRRGRARARLARAMQQPPEDGTAATTFTAVSTRSFAVNRAARTVEGIVLPYGVDQVADSWFASYRFEPGALQHSEDSRVKLLRDHEVRQPLGKLVYSEDRPEGRFARFQVARGVAGDEALSLAEDGVLDGFSVGVDFDFEADTIPDPENKGVTLVRRAYWRETSLTPMPAFDDARVSKVDASRMNGVRMDECTTCGQRHAPGACPTTGPTNTEAQGLSLSEDQLTALLTRPGALQALIQRPEPAPAAPAGALTLSTDQVDALIKSGGLGTLLGMPQLAASTPATEPTEPRQIVNPTRPVATLSVREEAPYRFDRAGNLNRGARHDFSTDIFAGIKGDGEALKRAEMFMREQFDVAGKIDTTDVTSLNPATARPDLYVDQKSFNYPLYTFANKGTLTDNTPFIFPVFASSSGLVGAHTEGTEPTAGDYKTTSTTITPSPVSGKVQITREVYDAGGNPQVSNLIWQAMLRGWFEAQEAAVVTILNGTTLTAQTIALTVAAVDTALTNELESKLAMLQFSRGGFTMRDMFIQADLFGVLVGAKDSTGRKVYPMQGVMNANGTISQLWGTLNLGGVAGHPEWALAAAGQTAPTPSYLADQSAISYWASAPQRLSFEYQVSTIDMGIWGYKAGVVNDVTGVRKITYDPVAP